MSLSSNERLSPAELDEKLAQAVREHEQAERLVCSYLLQIQHRRAYEAFGFANVYDYALERFGFSRRKTAALLFLARRLSDLPFLTEALTEGRLGWTKAVKVASVATRKDEQEWIRTASVLSHRQLEETLRDDLTPGAGRMTFLLSEEQKSVLARAMEICRRMCGADVDPAACLELIAGEFLATYESLMHEAEREAGEKTTAAGRPQEGAGAESAADGAIDEGPLDDRLMCPDDEETLPSPMAKAYTKVHRRVLARDGYRCQYPDCSVRGHLHVHHILYRSRFGTKSWRICNDEENLVTLCWTHHRMLHAHIIDVTGPPGFRRWARPKLMEWAAGRHTAPFGNDLREVGEPVGDFEVVSSG